jgi:multiple sugar transport system substrate-binding protein
MEGFVNSDKAVAGLEFYKSLYDCCSPPGMSNAYMGEGVDAFKSGQVAMQMNFAFTWPGFKTDPNVGGDKTGYFANPKPAPMASSSPSWAGRASRSFLLPTSRSSPRFPTSSGSPSPKCRRNGGRSAASPCLKAVVEDPALPPASPMRRPSSTAWPS